MLTLLARFFKALNSETGAWALAFAFVLGMIMGITPLWRVHNLLILLVALLFRVNLTGFLLSWAVFSAIAYLVDPISHAIGAAVLAAEAWQPVWTAMYQSAVWRVVQFHHTITMGSLILSALFAPILAVISYFIVSRYRQHIQRWFMQLKLVQMFKASRLFQIYAGLKGE
ncbi:TIGR03546 family protein [Pseudidiomarina taiwanensis]|uniref:DUF2062 domain-containing protein n=1 Tax=Pseudidiomarina taiwanensis TaxID=337250 RepID=A0A432ZCK4_9GAMM|nr:TIGR03546 family protein [Pseudidiomarina taiwanensis]RUO75641.1 DUF2062 domain-containing protein [Pseudidiomarina taiwanensis]